MKRRRPFIIWVVIFLFLILGWQGILRTWQAMADWQTLLTLEINVSPLYLSVIGIIWAVSGLIPAFGLWFRKSWALAAARIGAAAAAFSYWADRLLFTVSPSSRTNLIFTAGLTVIMLFYIFAVLSLQPTRIYLEKK